MGAQEESLPNFYSRRFSTEFQGLGKIPERLGQGAGMAELVRDGEGGPSGAASQPSICISELHFMT